MTRLTELSRRQAQQLAELETRISLLEAESRRTRAADAGKLSETVRIGEHVRKGAAAESPPPPLSTSDPSSSNDDTAAPISLRLRGRPGRVARPLEPLPTVNERLPVAPLPGKLLPEGKGQASGSPTPQKSPEAAYRRALGLLKERHFDRALSAFEGFVRRHPNHALVASAIYWQAEAHYAKREYPEALLDFTQVLQRFPGSEKAPKALYKLALCHERLGDRAAAARCLARLRKEFPDSELAKRTSAEGSS